METLTLTKEGKKFWKNLTKRHKILVQEDRESLELNGGYWDGGSRNDYYLVSKTGAIKPLTTTGAPPFDNRPVPTITIPEDHAIVKGGFFCGKPATLIVYTKSKQGWTF